VIEMHQQQLCVNTPTTTITVTDMETGTHLSLDIEMINVGDKRMLREHGSGKASSSNEPRGGGGVAASSADPLRDDHTTVRVAACSRNPSPWQSSHASSYDNVEGDDVDDEEEATSVAEEVD
jgi:hypothetical protein